MSLPALNSPRMFTLLLCLASGCATVRPGAPPPFKTYASVGDRPYPIVSSSDDGDSVASGRVEPERLGREAGVIAGRVVDPRGRPIAGVQVRLASDGAGRGRVNTAETDQAGGFTLRGLRPGSPYTLIAEYEDGDEVFTRRIEAEAPDERVRITMGGEEGEVPTYAGTPRPSFSRASSVRKGSASGGVEVALDSRLRVNPSDIEPPPADEAESLEGPDPRLDTASDDPPPPSNRKARPSGAWRPSGSATIEAESSPARDGVAPRVTARRADEGDEDDPLPPAIERPTPRPEPTPVFTEPTPTPTPTPSARVRQQPPAAAPRARPRPDPEPISQAEEPRREPQPPVIDEPSRPIHRAPPVLDFTDRTPKVAAAPAASEAPPEPAMPDLPAQPPAEAPSTSDGRVEPESPAPAPEPTAPSPDAPEPSPTIPAEPAEHVVPSPPTEEPPGLPPSDPIPTPEPSGDSSLPDMPAADPTLPPVEMPPSLPESDPVAPAPESDNQVEKTAEFPAEKDTADLGPRNRIRWGQLVVQNKPRAGSPGTLEPEARRASAILPGTKAKRAEATEAEPSAGRSEASSSPRRGEVVCKLDPVGKRITSLQAPDILGRDIRLEDLDSDLILLDFWGTWCSPCRDAIPHLVELQKQHGPKKLRVLGIAYEQAPIDRRASLVAETGRKLGVNYPLLLGLSDTPCPIRDALRIQVYPTMVLLDRQGRILWRQEGATQQTLARLDRAVAIALQEGAGAESVRR